ncbi:hypothetical protein [Achromobacter animicus]|uniref:hypothetical protein n=1 Tax=Achromobacter animicus TaxID=1389935 RepID=UPI001582B0BB|nr:hypothetical protein [Achromobacter animicus]
MTATPPDPLATQHDSTPDPDDQGPADSQTMRLREENRALRELLAAQVQASLPRNEPGWFKRLCWWLISAPGAALVGWRGLLRRDEGEPITRRRLGCATVTVVYTLAIYGALVLLVVSWNSPNSATSGTTAASPVRVPLTPQPPLSSGVDAAANGGASAPGGAQSERPSESAPSSMEPAVSTSIEPDPKPATPPAADAAPSITAPSERGSSAAPERVPAPVSSAEPAPAAPQSTLRITEIPAPDPMAWVAVLDGELAQCAELGFFERPECAWAARKQYCEPNQGWGKVKECPAQP